MGGMGFEMIGRCYKFFNKTVDFLKNLSSALRGATLLNQLNIFTLKSKQIDKVQTTYSWYTYFL